jgi:hypothetical protein
LAPVIVEVVAQPGTAQNEIAAAKMIAAAFRRLHAVAIFSSRICFAGIRVAFSDRSTSTSPKQ